MGTFSQTVDQFNLTASCDTVETGNTTGVISYKVPHDKTLVKTITLSVPDNVEIDPKVTFKYYATVTASRSTLTVGSDTMEVTTTSSLKSGGAVMQKTLETTAEVVGKQLRLTFKLTVNNPSIYSSTVTSTANIWGTIEGSYTENVGKPSAPTNVYIKPLAVQVDKTATATIAGAEKGINNPISGYEIQKRESTDCTNWGNWAALTTKGASETSFQVSPATEAGHYLQLRVRTVGTTTDATKKYSDWVLFPGYLLAEAIPDAEDPDADTKGATVKEADSDPFEIWPPYLTVHIWRRVS